MLIVVFVTTGVSVSVDNTPRRLVVEVGLLVSPRRRVVKHVREKGYIGWAECGFAMVFCVAYGFHCTSA